MILAVWSGPRNLSTALMYSFANRADCAEAVDEPFFAAWLAATGRPHPMREETLASQPNDPEQVARAISSPAPGLRYLKLMAHHMLPDFPMDWAGGERIRHVHLLRHPARVIASYLAKREEPTHEELGYAHQEEILARAPGPVIEAEAIRADPEGALRRLCEAVGLPFDPAMLSWPAGPKPFDGAWAPHWYGAVHASTRFAPAEGPPPEVPHAALMGHAMPIYERLRDRAI